MSGISGIYRSRSASLFSRGTLLGLLAAALCGGLVALSVPPWGFWPLAFVGILGLDFLLDDCPTKIRFVRGLCFGVGWLFPTFIWMWDFSPVGYVSAGVGFTIFYGVGLGLCPKDSRLRWWVLPAVLVLVGYLRWRWPFGGVPLSTLSMSQAGSPLLKTSSIFGSLLLVWLVGLVAVSLAALWRRQWWQAAAGPVILGLALGLVPLAPQAHRVGTIDVALVQGGGEQRTRAADTDLTAVFGAHLEASYNLIQQPVDLIIWPENVVDVAGQFNELTPQAAQLAELAETLDAPLIAGVIEDAEPGKFNNFSIVITPTRQIGDRYDKVRRVPFGEYVPLRWLVEPFAPDYLPDREAATGSGPAVLTIELPGAADAPASGSAAESAQPTSTVKLGTVISWEIFFEDRARDAIANGGQIVVNPTNGSSYWLSIVQSQQVAASRLRAVETDRYVLQVAPTGFTAVISPNGEVLQRTAISEQRVLHATVELREGDTLAVRLGVWPMLGLASLSCLVALTQLARQRRQVSHSGIGRKR